MKKVILSSGHFIRNPNPRRQEKPENFEDRIQPKNGYVVQFNP